MDRGQLIALPTFDGPVVFSHSLISPRTSGGFDPLFAERKRMTDNTCSVRNSARRLGKRVRETPVEEQLPLQELNSLGQFLVGRSRPAHHFAKVHEFIRPSEIIPD